ncbi:hydroxymethylglutaryl-CoA lyase [Pseudovibrio sp. SPO723]|uniref:hydroxymethylglutaryl-CoA lyase n=1 Tax=Nesiotobacter zosterae TaxID=392721 RepID=UPI0029C395B1|nr:hydroxymethylglutaryl-CoA lyase [Pseudovibrio sp. SPO723]MDX5595555.1 hydroxymethylglutaryl-CoA lyase [Pseudovibrio sp. SPO723]
MSDHVTLFEMGPRDGLQNEKVLISTPAKIALIDQLSGCGFTKIEATSFVSPKWVPQMADAAQVLAGITRKPGVKYTALTPNLKGYDRAREAKADEVAVFGSASEGFSQANINCSVAESFERFAPIIEQAKSDGIPVRGYVSCVIRCPYDGDTDPAMVASVAKRMIEMGCYEISLGDTIGAGTPKTIRAMLKAVLQEVPADRLAGHYHDTGDRAVSNIEASLELGLRTFDAAIGGLGGCPYAPGAKGNVNTIEVAARLHELGLHTGLDMTACQKAAAFIMGLKEAAA